MILNLVIISPNFHAYYIVCKVSVLLLFQPVQTSEHMGALGVFGLCQIVSFVTYVKSRLSSTQFDTLWRFMFYVIGAIVAAIVGFLTLAGE